MRICFFSGGFSSVGGIGRSTSITLYSLFLKSCLDNGLKIYAVPYALAFLNEDRPSTWVNGYTDKYFFDKGVLYSCLYKK